MRSRVRLNLLWFHRHWCTQKQVKSLGQMKQQVNRVQLGSLFSFLPIRFHFMHVLLLRVIWLAYAEPRFHFRDVESSPSGVASYHPLGANKKRRRCTLALDSESPLVHSTQTTKPTGSAPDLDGRAGEADLICLLTDGSPDHTQPPACQPCWSGSGPPAARLERARGRRWRWLLLNMKRRSLGMSALFRPGEAQRIDSLIREINWARFHSACVAEWKVVLTRGSRIRLLYCLMPWFIPPSKQQSILKNSFLPQQIFYELILQADLLLRCRRSSWNSSFPQRADLLCASYSHR